VTHWFDRLARSAASRDEGGVSRRGVLAGAAVAAVAASPLASAGTASAGRRVESFAAQAGCVPCLTLSIKNHNKRARNCLKTGNPSRSRPVRNKKGKVTPVSAAKKLGCVAKSRAELGGDVNDCRRISCEGPSAPPIVGAQPGTSGCPNGTTVCSDGSCCYAGDLCCACPSGMTCCVAAVGCGCC
jgi:hypothetical protein